MTRRRYHMFRYVDDRGRVSPACAERPRALDMKRATWTPRWEAVTCPRCLALKGTAEDPTLEFGA